MWVSFSPNTHAWKPDVALTALTSSNLVVTAPVSQLQKLGPQELCLEQRLWVDGYHRQNPQLQTLGPVLIAPTHSRGQ